MKLQNKVIAITGASDGIGREIALRLAQEGTNLALIARSAEKLDETKKKAEDLGAKSVRTYVCDLRRTEDLEHTAKAVVLDFGRTDILINDAGVWQKLNPLENIEPDTIDEVIGTNLSALIHATRFFLPHLKEQKEAAIVNVVSKSGLVAQKGQSVYTASKYGVRGFTEVLREDLKGSGVRVAGVYQSGTDTKMFEKTGEAFATDTFTKAADLADVVAYMLSRPERIWLNEVCIDH